MIKVCSSSLRAHMLSGATSFASMLCFALFRLFFPRCDTELLVGQIWITQRRRKENNQSEIATARRFPSLASMAILVEAKTRLENQHTIAAAFVEMMGMSKKPIPDSRRLVRLLSTCSLFFLLYLFIYFIFSSSFSSCSLPCTNLQSFYLFIYVYFSLNSVEKFRNLAIFFYEIKKVKILILRGFFLPFF